MGFPSNYTRKRMFVFSVYVTFLFCVEKQTYTSHIWNTINLQMNGGQNVVKDYYRYDLRIMLFHNASFSFLLLLEKTNTFF